MNDAWRDKHNPAECSAEFYAMANRRQHEASRAPITHAETKIDALAKKVDRLIELVELLHVPVEEDEYLKDFDQKKEDEATQKWLDEG